MAGKKGSTPGNHREMMERLEHFYSLPIDEQTAILAKSNPQLAADNLLRHEEKLRHDARLDGIGKPTRRDKTEHPPELTRLHRLTKDEADLIHEWRLLGDEFKPALRAIAASLTMDAPAINRNVVSIARRPD